MGFHTFDADRADKLEDEARYRYLSREELVDAIEPDPDEVLADLGSGTGFYTDDVAPFAGAIRAVDLQRAMHDRYREKGLPANVSLVTADVADLPFADAELDGAFSTMTFHEFASEAALSEVARVLRPGGRFVVADWSAAGDGESGPPVAERYDREAVVELLDSAGFDVQCADERPETVLAVASR